MNIASLGISMAAMVLGLFWLIWILWTLIKLGGGAIYDGHVIHWKIFTEMTPAPGSEGGLKNAIVGSLLMVATGTFIGTPIGIMAGTYLAEFGNRGWLAPTTRFINDILLSAPSIIIGLFIYTIYIRQIGHFSGWGGTFALSLLVIPVVVGTTENMLRLVPNSLREAASALGAPQWRIVSFVTLRAARTGILTGVLLAVARISGETAPLLFTALNNQFWSMDMSHPMANLPSVINAFATNSTFEHLYQLAWAASLIITASVLILNILGRVVFRQEKTS